MNVRRFSALAAVAGLLSLAACGDPDNPPVAKAPAQQRTVEDITSNMPAEWPATQACATPRPRPSPRTGARGTPRRPPSRRFPRYGSPWYPTPAPETSDTIGDPCLARPHGVPRPC